MKPTFRRWHQCPEANWSFESFV